MTHPIRPVKTFILRLWREPGDPKAEAGWRGLIRPLDAGAARADGQALPFNGLENLLAALRALLDEGVGSKEGASPRPPAG